MSNYFLSGPLPLPGGGNTIKFTQFTSSGTWTKDAESVQVTAILMSGGGGGGSGAVSGLLGSGGSGGASNILIISQPSSFFDATEPVVVGTGGSGGAAVSTNDTVGNFGSIAGTTTSFGIFSVDGTAGQGGRLDGGLNFGSSNKSFYSLYPGSEATFFTGGSQHDFSGQAGQNIGLNSSGIFMAGSGGGGGGNRIADPSFGGLGAAVPFYSGGTAGDPSGVRNGGNGSDFIFSTYPGVLQGGSGGGGGAGNTQPGGDDGGSGGNGGYPGGGGGGGGAAVNGDTSGSGGDGSDGIVWIYEVLG